jgi:hypothetical protein
MRPSPVPWSRRFYFSSDPRRGPPVFPRQNGTAERETTRDDHNLDCPRSRFHKKFRCGERDLNPRTPTRPDPESGAFDQAGRSPRDLRGTVDGYESAAGGTFDGPRVPTGTCADSPPRKVRGSPVEAPAYIFFSKSRIVANIEEKRWFDSTPNSSCHTSRTARILCRTWPISRPSGPSISY